MRILIYKRTHDDDPGDSGCFGIYGCMGSVRKWKFDAIIGIGGIGGEATENDIAGRITWIGIGPSPQGWRRHGPILTFDNFRNFGANGPDFCVKSPKLAGRIYSNNIRTIMDSMTPRQQEEAEKILRMARNYPPSPGRKKTNGPLLLRASKKQVC